MGNLCFLPPSILTGGLGGVEFIMSHPPLHTISCTESSLISFNYEPYVLRRRLPALAKTTGTYR